MSNKSLIYAPRGRALEYSPLACNLFTGCIHSCKYCFGPSLLHKKRREYEAGIQVKDDVVKRFEQDAKKFEGDPREILFSFFTDVYQTEESTKIMREVLEICSKYKLRIQVLTKAGKNITDDDFEMFRKNNWKFGSTVCFMDEKLREEWEPGAPSIQSRIDAIKFASQVGVFTWVSIEPVINTQSALDVIDELKGYVDLWKVGKLNHFPEIEATIDWKQFLKDAMTKLNGERTIFKKDLMEFIIK